MLKHKKYSMLFDIDKQLTYGRKLTYQHCRYLKIVVAKLKADIPAELALEDDMLEPIQIGKCTQQYRMAKMQRDENLKHAFEHLPPSNDSNEGKLIFMGTLIDQTVKNYDAGRPPVNGFELHIYEILKAGSKIPQTTRQLRKIILNN